MPMEFEPILKSEQEKRDKLYENFANTKIMDDEVAGSVVGSIFIGISLMTLAMLLTWLFIWGYNKDRSLFIAIFAALIFAYSIKVLVYVIILRTKVSVPVFRVYLGSAIFMIFTSIVMIVFFSIKASRKLKSSTGYIPPSVQEYINPT